MRITNKWVWYTTLPCIFLFIPFIAKADIWDTILGKLEEQTDLQQKIEQYTSQLPKLYQKNLQQLMNTTELDFANISYNSNLQSWGTDTDKWQNVINIYQKGNSGLGAVANQLNRDFPIQPTRIITAHPTSPAAKYYTLQAQTALAARAASQFDYDNIKEQIEYMHQLHDMISQTKTIKDAIDLQNRLQVEGNLIHLEVLRLSALNNQQQAITAQGRINAVINNAKAFQ